MQEAVKKLLEPFPDLESAGGEIAIIGVMLQALKELPYIILEKLKNFKNFLS